MLSSFYDIKENIETIIHALAYHPDEAKPERTGFGIEDHLRNLYYTSDDAAWITRKLNDYIDDPKYEFKKSHTVFLIDLFANSSHPLKIEDIEIYPEDAQLSYEESCLQSC